MEINKRQQLFRKRTSTLEYAIQNAIDKVCMEANYEILYCEINNALIKILNSNNGFEAKALWEEEEDKNETDGDK